MYIYNCYRNSPTTCWWGLVVETEKRVNFTLLAIYGKLDGSGSSDVTHGLHEVSATDPFEVAGSIRTGKSRETGGSEHVKGVEAETAPSPTPPKNKLRGLFRRGQMKLEKRKRFVLQTRILQKNNARKV